MAITQVGGERLTRIAVVGSYTGDGTNNRQIDIGWQPKAVEIIRESSPESRAFKSDSMPGQKFIRSNTIVFAGNSVIYENNNGIVINQTGFVVNTHTAINENGKQYKYLAFR